MKIIIKNIISLALPVLVLLLVPYWIEKNLSVAHYGFLLIGMVFIIMGIIMMIHTITIFIKTGNGTLAPWSPTKKMVIKGLYRYVRNPMITGVIIILIGESLAFHSFKILIWALIFFVINNLFFVLYEEPDLERKFGDEYKNYKKNVPRWIPRLTPFNAISET